MENIVSLLVGFVGTLAALLVTKTVEYSLLRKLNASELARDALIDFASTITNLEGTVERLRNEPELKVPKDLVQVPSEYRREPPTIPIDRLLAGFSDERLHRLLMLFFNRHKLFAERSNERKAAFYWLLDNPSVEWAEPRAAERVETIRRSSSDLIRYSLDMLKFAFEVLEELYAIAERGVSLLRGDFTDTRTFLKSTYGLTQETISLRRAYYSSEYLPGRTTILPRFNPRVEYQKVKWEDEKAADLASRGGRLVLELSVSGMEPLSVALRPFVEVAVPHGASVRAARVLYQEADGTFVEKEVATSVLQATSPYVSTNIRVDVGRSLSEDTPAGTERQSRRRVERTD